MNTWTIVLVCLQLMFFVLPMLRDALQVHQVMSLVLSLNLEYLPCRCQHSKKSHRKPIIFISKHLERNNDLFFHHSNLSVSSWITITIFWTTYFSNFEEFANTIHSYQESFIQIQCIFALFLVHIEVFLQ